VPDILELASTTVERRDGAVHHRSEIHFQHDKLPPGSVTLSVPEEWADWVDHSPAALVPVALVLAARLGDDLRVAAPIDADVQAACRRAIAVQSAWFGWRTPELIAPFGVDRRPRPKRNRALFFTGGIDSWGSLLALQEGPRRDRPTHLVMIDGDSHLPEAVRAATVARTRSTAERIGLPLVVVRSDLRALFDPHTRWDYETHGGVLAGTGYLLRNGLGRITIAATNSWPDAIPYGSHPLLDPLWATPHLDVVHHLPEERRWERTLRVAADPLARTTLDVCWEARQVGNCGRCQKCLMTMTSLVLSGRTGWEGCFDVPWDPDNIAGISHANPTPLLISIEHCDAAGVVADPIRQRWEPISPGSDAVYRYRRMPTGPRVPVRTPEGRPPPPVVAVPLGRLLAPLGCRVDHVGSDRDGLVADVVDGRLQVAATGDDLRPVSSTDDLIPLLDALGIAPDPEAAFDPDGHRWDDEAWIRQRKLDPAATEIPGVDHR
jgi:hypothetical protein